MRDCRRFEVYCANKKYNTSGHSMPNHAMSNSPMSDYGRFAEIIGTSTVIMFGLMYLNTYKKDHIYFSENRAYMALIMGAVMAPIMLSGMPDMYNDRRMNTNIYFLSAFVFVLALWLLRSQALIDDVSWMKSMIPHHSIAILTSERANLTDPRVKDLANRIIESQREEIEEMKVLIRDIECKKQ